VTVYSLLSISETVYIETSILGYLTAKSTKNLIIAGNIEITKDWWELRRSAFTPYISQVVLDEISQGDAAIAAQRLEVARGISLLEVTEAVENLAAQFMARSNLPSKASESCSSHCIGDGQ
jgi:DUF1009 family protein